MLISPLGLFCNMKHCTQMSVHPNAGPIVIVTDAWRPQTNGVVTTLTQVCNHLVERGYDVQVVEPSRFPTVPLPNYPEIRLALGFGHIARSLAELRPQCIHIATEGPLGLAARRYCLQRGMPFTTAVHTKFPEYVNERVGLPVALGYRAVKRFHQPAVRTLCTTPSHMAELQNYGFDHLVVWGRGVDTEQFAPLPRAERQLPRLVYVGRVAVEKNLEAFLELPCAGTKVVVGDGPAKASLQRRYPHAHWLGKLTGHALREQYAQADVKVFPSRTDTFGLVMLEAIACGTPVAAYPVTGPVDVVQEKINGALDHDLAQAVQRALAVSRTRTREFALQHSWQTIAARFLQSLAPMSFAREKIGRHDGPPRVAA